MSNTYFNISDKLRLYEFDGMLDQYGDAAAAYSLRKLRNGYTGDAIRVRRSSDNTERDMGFYDNELDTVALLDWVNADHIKYESDFRLGGDNFSTLELQSLNGESIAGEDNAIKFTLTGGLSNHYAYRGPIAIGQTMKVTGRYYIPSTNASCNAIRISGGSSEFIFANTLDEWAEFEHITTATVSYAIFRAANGTNANLDGDGDVFYLKDLVYTQITADGHVHTWYDQSANANHAVQGTDSAQPKIVDAGTLFTENGKAAILDLNENKSLTAGLINFASGNWNITQVVTTKGTDINTSIGADGVDDLFFEPNRTGIGLRMFWRNNLTLEESPATDRTNQQFIGFYNNNNNFLEQHINSTLINSGVATNGPRSTSQIFLFSWNTNQSGNVALQEAIFWQLDQSTKRADIESNINDYYSIY